MTRSSKKDPCPALRVLAGELGLACPMHIGRGDATGRESLDVDRVDVDGTAGCLENDFSSFGRRGTVDTGGSVPFVLRFLYWFQWRPVI